MCGHIINAVKMEIDADGWMSCLREPKQVKQAETEKREREENF